MDVKLTVQKGGQAAQTFLLRKAEMVIGRQKGCGVRIPSGEVSRQHCMVSYQNDLLAVEDLSSANGTFINGRRIDRREILRPGDKLKVGPITLLVQYQLTEAAVQRLLHEDDEEVVISPLDEVELVDEDHAEVELVLEGEDGPLVMDGELDLEGEQGPLEALRAIDEQAAEEMPKSSAKKKKPGGDKKTKTTNSPLPFQFESDAPATPQRMKRSNLDEAASADSGEPSADDDDDTATPDASQILGHKNWQLPTGEDIRDILAQIEKGKKKKS